MFGLPLPNLDEMTKMVADFQVRHERMVRTLENLDRKITLLMALLPPETVARIQQLEGDNQND